MPDRTARPACNGGSLSFFIGYSQQLLPSTQPLSQGRLLDGHKELLVAALALQDRSACYQLSRSPFSPAQELQALRQMNTALADLLSPGSRHVLKH